MDVDFPVELENEDRNQDDFSVVDDEDAPIVPMPQSGGIEVLRDKLHARMAALRRGGGGRAGGIGATASGRDELLEERRRQRAAMREKRRKETKEKIKREEEMKGKKAKEKDKDQRDKGKLVKVWLFLPEGSYVDDDSDLISIDPATSPRRHEFPT